MALVHIRSGRGMVVPRNIRTQYQRTTNVSPHCRSNIRYIHLSYL